MYAIRSYYAIWKKAGQAAGTDAAVMDFLAGQDVVCDRQLIAYDIRASQAHAEGLAAIGVLSDAEAGRLVEALAEIGRRLEAGRNNFV